MFVLFFDINYCLDHLKLNDALFVSNHSNITLIMFLVYRKNNVPPNRHDNYKIHGNFSKHKQYSWRL